MACKVLDGLIHDDRYKVENEINFYKDEIYFVPESTLKEKLVRATHNKPIEVTIKSHPQDKDCLDNENLIAATREERDTRPIGMQTQYPANTNISYVDWPIVEQLGSNKTAASLPAMILNQRNFITYEVYLGVKHSLYASRLEETMENMMHGT